jgi:hypothetical protein
MNGLKVRPAIRSEVDNLVYRHYLHSWPAVVTRILCLERGEILNPIIGVIVFAAPPREIHKRYGVSRAWELARLFIEDEEPINTESFFISRAIQWVQKNRPDIQLLVSYADPAVGHQGVIYKASNWISDSRTDCERKNPRVDYMAYGKRYSRKAHVPAGAPCTRVYRSSKWRFIYWMKDHERKRQELRKVAQ